MEFAEMLEAAKGGDAEAQYKTAQAYRTGGGVAQSDVQAVEWYGKAADQNHLQAICDLGSMYLEGLGVLQDAVRAATLFREAADQGLDTAQYNLSLLYLEGNGVERDDNEGAVLMAMAGRQGYMIAINDMGTLYRLGRGVAQDFSTAAMLHLLAAAEGDSMAIASLTDCLPELEKIALNGGESASVSLAKMYDRGLGVEQDAATALAWIRWAKSHTTPDVDDSVGKEMEKLEFEHIIMDTPEVEAKADTLLAEMERSREAGRPS